MSFLFKASILILLISHECISQEPVSVLSSRWYRTVTPAPKPTTTAAGPSRPITADDKYFTRTARAARTDNPMDPYENSMDGRSAAIDKAVQESRAHQPDDVVGYTYVAEFRNETGKSIAVIFWEYEFTEISNRANVSRRQFLCGAKLKNGERKEYSAFSLLGPSDALDVNSLAKPTDKLFEEVALINRIELADGSILQRDTWKYSDVKKAVERATSTPWGKETCRAL